MMIYRECDEEELVERFVDMSAFSTTEEDLTFISNSILTVETKDNFLTILKRQRIILLTALALGKEI